ncbi:hypothetical protein D3C72_1357770 [compost metagenome]
MGGSTVARHESVGETLDLSFAVQLLRRALGVDQRGLVQQIVVASARCGAIENLGAEAGDAGAVQEVPSVGRDARSLGQGQVKAVDAYRSHEIPRT